MTYNVFGGTLSLTQSIRESHGLLNAYATMTSRQCQQQDATELLSK